MERYALIEVNGIYYFCSTLAQTLASISGFLAAFVLLRLQAWNGELSWASSRLKELRWKHGKGPDAAELVSKCYVGDRTEADQLLKDFTFTDTDSLFNLKRDTANAVDMCVRIGLARPQLLKYFWWAMTSAGIAILIALVALPCALRISLSSCATIGVLSGVSILVTIHVWSVTKLLRIAVALEQKP